MSYIPPFTVSARAINLIAEISGLIERYAIRLEQEDEPSQDHSLTLCWVKSTRH